MLFTSTCFLHIRPERRFGFAQLQGILELVGGCFAHLPPQALIPLMQTNDLLCSHLHHPLDGPELPLLGCMASWSLFKSRS
ncbi:hypothetical protein COP2_023314 [Malus domestica]